MAKSKDIRVSEKGKVLLRKFNKAKASLPYKDLGLMAGAGAVGGITAAGVMKHHQHKYVIQPGLLKWGTDTEPGSDIMRPRLLPLRTQPAQCKPQLSLSLTRPAQPRECSQRRY